MDRTKTTAWATPADNIRVRTDGTGFVVSTESGMLGEVMVTKEVGYVQIPVSMFYNRAAVTTYQLGLLHTMGRLHRMWVDGMELFVEKLPEQDVPADADDTDDEPYYGKSIIPDWASVKLDEYASLTGVTGGEFAARLIIDGLRRLDREVLRTIENTIHDPSDDLF